MRERANKQMTKEQEDEQEEQPLLSLPLLLLRQRHHPPLVLLSLQARLLGVADPERVACRCASSNQLTELTRSL